MDEGRIVVGVDGSPVAQEALPWACQLARLWGADLVVTGSMSGGPATDLLSGSVSRQVVVETHRPTLVVPDGWVRRRSTARDGEG